MENKHNLWLTLGIGNHAIFLTVIYFGYVASGFKFHGDDFGGVMMVYALTLFIPQLFFELLVFVMFLINTLRTEIMDINKNLIISFFSTLSFVVLTIILIDSSKY